MFRHENHMVVQNDAGELEAKLVVNCAGLQSDRIAWLSGSRPDAQIIPFRGEYFELKPSAHHLCRALIYPVPDPQFPFLGVHFTRMIHGGVECGPNAVFSFAREGYYKTSFNLFDTLESLTYPGFLRMAWRHWRAGLNEMYRSFNKGAFVAALQRLVPEVRAEHLVVPNTGGRSRSSTDARWKSGRRFLDHRKRACSERVQCSVACGHSVAQHRQPDRRQNGSPFRMNRFIDCSLCST